MESGTDYDDAIYYNDKKFEPLEHFVEEKLILEKVDEEEHGEDSITKV